MLNLWIDDYRPRNLQKLTYHPELTNTLTKLAANQEFPHLLFYGPDGAGKKTRIMCFLKDIYGDGVYSLTSESKEFKVNSTTIEFSILSSKYHIDMCPADAEFHDKVIIQKTIKEIASTH